MKAIILAAGIGSRLGDIGNNMPKCLIKIGGTTILERNLRMLENVGIKKEDIVVVIGDKGDVWSENNKDRIKKIHPHVIINHENIEKNQSYSFWLAVKDLQDNLLCIDGDSVFDEGILRRLVQDAHDSAFFTRVTSGEKRTKVLIDENQLVIDLGKEIDSDRTYTPILKFSSSFLQALKHEILVSPDKYFQTSIDKVIKAICMNHKIYNVNLSRLGDDSKLFININTPEEYNRALEVFGSRPFVALMFGYTGVGKSTTAIKIADIPNTEIFHSAVIRKNLGLTPKTPEEADKFFDWRNNMRQEVDRKVYSLLAEKAVDSVKKGKNVVLDAGYFFNWQRQLVYEKIREFKPEMFVIKVTCKDENEIRRRFKDRADKFHDSPLNETPSWNTYEATKLLTESIDKDMAENSEIKVIEYDTKTKLLISHIKEKSVNADRISKAIVTY